MISFTTSQNQVHHLR